MGKWILAVIFLAGMAWGQNTPTIGVLPDNGPSLPATCVIGQIYFRTATTIGLNQCNPANTWTALSTGAGSSPGSPVNSVQWNSAGSFAGTSGLTTDAVGNFTLVGGTITTSAPMMSQTVTWNAAGVAFTNWLSNITCTAAATASIAAGLGTAGTQWQFKYGGANCASPQLLSPTSSGTTNPAYSFSGSTNTGIGFNANNSGKMVFSASGFDGFSVDSNNGPVIRSDVPLMWANANSVFNAVTIDTAISRSAAGVIAVGVSNTAGSTTGKVKASGYMSVGTKFTTNNGCTDSATAGGATAGTFTVGSTSCTEVITMGDSATAPNGWSCTVVDITTLADVTNPHQTTSNATTATIVTGTVVSGDKIQFSCIGY
jgi:hypothetical protein